MRGIRGSKVLGLMLVFSVLFAGVALADGLVQTEFDGDNLVLSDPQAADFGEVCPESTANYVVRLAIEREGSGQVFNNSAEVTVVHDRTDVDANNAALGTLTPAASSSNVLQVGKIDLPSYWQNQGTLSDSLTYTLTFEAGTDEGEFEATVRFVASGAGANDRNLTLPVFAEITEEACVPAGNAVYFDGFHRPIDMDADYVVAKAGQGIALKWNVFEDEDLTAEIPDAVDDHTVSSKKVPCDLSGEGNDTPDADDAGKSSLRWDEVEGQHVFVWKTLKNWANTCREFTVSYDDGDISGDLSVTVRFTK